MNEKTLKVLEFSKVIDRLAGYASFSASADLARALQPQVDPAAIKILQKQTGESLLLLTTSDFTGIGGAHDVRDLVERAARGGVLEPPEIQDIKATLISGRDLLRAFERKEDRFPLLLQILQQISLPLGIIESINLVISDQTEVLDSASIRLAHLRTELKVTHERLFSKLQRIIGDTHTAPMLQESIITQRDGRYVIPLRSEFKGQLKSIVHDQSSSGATLFVEPLVVVELNNQLRELELEERNEVHRILSELSRKIGEKQAEITGIVGALAQFDLAIMRARYALDIQGVEPEWVENDNKAKTSAHSAPIKLLQARHPLLDPQKVVPIDILFEPGTYCLVITGPNTGGKTVTLKTVGLLVLMAQSGMYIPAQSGSELGVFEAVFADIGDEQSIEQSLSTFSGHVKNLVHILRFANEQSLVLLDELGAGTDPQEGSTLARAILEFLLGKCITSLVATHYPELKAFAYNRSGVMNASLEFNLKTLRPTYHLILGIPGKSNALVIAERLGMPVEIIEKARAALSPEDLQTDNMLDEITRQREASRKVRSSADRIRTEMEKRQQDLDKRLENIEIERKQILTSARKKAEADLEEVTSEIDIARRELVKARQSLKPIGEISKSTDSIHQMIKSMDISEVTPPVVTPSDIPYKHGDKVFIISLQMRAVITDVGEDDVEVQFGSLRARTQFNDISRDNPSEDLGKTETGRSRLHRSPAPPRPDVFRESPGLELSIRGQRAEDAISMVERYLEQAYMARLPFARIVHGKGTGVLRQVVQDMLKSSPYVEKWELASEKEGGAGVTIVKFKAD
jgi:DNA mismatch repair protein MutS2